MGVFANSRCFWLTIWYGLGYIGLHSSYLLPVRATLVDAQDWMELGFECFDDEETVHVLQSFLAIKQQFVLVDHREDQGQSEQRGADGTMDVSVIDFPTSFSAQSSSISAVSNKSAQATLIPKLVVEKCSKLEDLDRVFSRLKKEDRRTAATGLGIPRTIQRAKMETLVPKMVLAYRVRYLDDHAADYQSDNDQEDGSGQGGEHGVGVVNASTPWYEQVADEFPILKTKTVHKILRRVVHQVGESAGIEHLKISDSAKGAVHQQLEIWIVARLCDSLHYAREIKTKGGTSEKYVKLLKLDEMSVRLAESRDVSSTILASDVTRFLRDLCKKVDIYEGDPRVDLDGFENIPDSMFRSALQVARKIDGGHEKVTMSKDIISNFKTFFHAVLKHVLKNAIQDWGSSPRSTLDVADVVPQFSSSHTFRALR